MLLLLIRPCCSRTGNIRPDRKLCPLRLITRRIDYSIHQHCTLCKTRPLQHAISPGKEVW